MAETKSIDSINAVSAPEVKDVDQVQLILDAARQLDVDLMENSNLGSSNCRDLVNRWYAKPTNRKIQIETMDGIITTTMCKYLSESDVLSDWLNKLDEKSDGQWIPYDDKEDGFAKVKKSTEKSTLPTFFMDCGKNDVMRWLYNVKKIPYESNRGGTTLVSAMNRRMRLNEWKVAAVQTLSQMLGIKLDLMLFRILVKNPESVKLASVFRQDHLLEWMIPLSAGSLQTLVKELTIWADWLVGNNLSEYPKPPSFLPTTLEKMPREFRPLRRDPLSHEFVTLDFGQISFRHVQASNSIVFTFHLPTKK